MCTMLLERMAEKRLQYMEYVLAGDPAKNTIGVDVAQIIH